MLSLQAPATWLASGVNSATKGQVQLQQARGTLWNGSAQLVLTGSQAETGEGSGMLPFLLAERLGWEPKPSAKPAAKRAGRAAPNPSDERQALVGKIEAQLAAETTGDGEVVRPQLAQPRQVEVALAGVNEGKVEAARSMGSGTLGLIFRV